MSGGAKALSDPDDVRSMDWADYGALDVSVSTYMIVFEVPTRPDLHHFKLSSRVPQKGTEPGFTSMMLFSLRDRAPQLGSALGVIFSRNILPGVVGHE